MLSYFRICLFSILWTIAFTYQPQNFEQIQTRYFDPGSSAMNLPPLSQVILWINTADILNLERIKQIYERKITETLCSESTNFIDQVLGISKMGIWIKNMAINSVIIEKMELESLASGLQEQITQIRSKKEEIGLPRLKQGGRTLLRSLQEKYSSISSTSLAINKRQGEVKRLIEQIQQIETVKSQDENQLFSQNIELELTEKQIDRVKAELEHLNSKKSKLQSTIAELSLQVHSKQQRIRQIQSQSDLLLEQIDYLSNFKQHLNQETLSIELELAKAEVQIQQNIGPDKTYNQQIDKKTYDLQEIKRKMSSLQNPSNLSTQIMILSRYVQQLQTLSVKAYYNCYVRQINYSLDYRSYDISASELAPYLQSLYSSRVPLPQISDFIFYKLTLIDLFGQLWAQNFGFPFNEIKVIENTLSLSEDFTCQEPELNPPQVAGRGILAFITNNRLQLVTKGNNRVILLLGACTRLQSNIIPPSINNLVYFRGFVISSELINPFLITVL